jgi:DNA excision repair protein ERCC-2
MDAAARSSLVVCDYNYLFSEIRERFLPRLGRSLEDLVVIVDEAHNLPDRIRAHLVGDLGVIDLLKAAKEARSIDGEVAQQLVGVAKSLERFVTALRSERIARKEEFLDVVEEGLRTKGGDARSYASLIEGVTFAGEDAIRRGLPTRLPEIAEFLVRWRDQNEGILRLVVPGAEGKFAFRLLDPSVLSRSIFDGVHASILMSGTLFPAEMYADLLGIPHGRRVLRTYASPFPRENRLLLVSPHVTTLFVKRGQEMHDSIAREIAGIASAVPGNLAAFFPSYELLEEAHRRIRAARIPKRILVERPQWTKTQRDGALEALRVARLEGAGALLLGVQGGSLSEGVDYHDNLLAAVIVVGLPLSPPSVEGEALRDYYARKFGFAKGHDYAVVYPAVNRLLQAAGRAIRSERDRAAIVLLEGRILEPRYARCLPPDFAPARSELPASDASRFLAPLA